MRHDASPRFFLAAACLSFLTTSVHAARPELTMTLDFTPTTTIGAAAPSLSSGAVARTLTIRVADDRTVTNPAVVGEGTDDDDSRFRVEASNDVGEFTDRVVRKLASGWGLRLSNQGELALVVHVVKFFASESNQPVGSMYVADVVLRGELEDPSGRILWRGVGSGDTRRYGKKQSRANYNEIFSDALQEALAGLLSRADLQVALKKGAPGPGAAETAAASAAAVGGGGGNAKSKLNATSPEKVLRELKTLIQKRFSEDFLLDYVRDTNYERAMTADDLVDWKDAGVPEGVIQAAHRKSTTGKP